MSELLLYKNLKLGLQPHLRMPFIHCNTLQRTQLGWSTNQPTRLSSAIRKKNICKWRMQRNNSKSSSLLNCIYVTLWMRSMSNTVIPNQGAAAH